MEKLPFLSDEWLSAATSLYERTPTTASLPALRVSVHVHHMPNDAPDCVLFLDGTSGKLQLVKDTTAKADVTLTTEYSYARELLLEGNSANALEAMQLGRVQVKGNIFKIMQLSKVFSAYPDNVRDALRAFTL